MLRGRVCIGEANVKGHAKGQRTGNGRIIEAEGRGPGMQTVPGEHEPIIGMGALGKVQARLAGSEPRTGIDRTPRSPPASIMRCAGCGKTTARRACTRKGVPTPIIVCRPSRRIAGQGSLEMVEGMVVAELGEELEGQQTVLASCSTGRQGDADGETLSFPQPGTARRGKAMERADGLHGLGGCSLCEVP